MYSLSAQLRAKPMNNKNSEMKVMSYFLTFEIIIYKWILVNMTPLITKPYVNGTFCEIKTYIKNPGSTLIQSYILKEI